MEKKCVFITGSTGVMGRETLRSVLRRGDCRVRLLVRDSKKNRRLLKPYLGRDDVEVVWGDLLDAEAVSRALGDARIVLHMGGLVSPMADRFPERTMKVNVGGTRNVVRAVKSRPYRDDIRLVYIGSVAQTSLRNPPVHWGRTGDPVISAQFDHYGLSKIRAERVVAESGLKHWVSLRQTGILHPGLFLRGSDPITFHVPLKGVLEWATLEDSGKLMAAMCGDDLPEELWRGFFNIGSGGDYRLTNYEFECLILGAVGSPRPEKIFETDWFATRNFHGCWFADSDRLQELVPFRDGIPAAEYFRQMVKKAPWWARLAPLAPAPVVKGMMKKVALTPGYGTLDWLRRSDCEDRINAFFGSRKERENIPGWKDIDLSRPSDTPSFLNHGYDESKPDTELGLADFRQAAAFRGGRCLAPDPGDPDPNPEAKIDVDPNPEAKVGLDTPVEWECAFGHRFSATPRIVLKGGHWCSECEGAPSRHAEALRNPFLSQIL